MSNAVTVNFLMAKPLPSAANLREHWATKARRVKTQRAAVGFLLRAVACFFREQWEYPVALGMVRLRVTMTRVAPRRLDDDNLAHAFKAIRDEVAAFFGHDDGEACWEWVPTQERGAPAVRIEVRAVEVVPRAVVASDVETDPSDYERPRPPPCVQGDSKLSRNSGGTR